MAADKPSAPLSPALDVLDTSWAPAGWTASEDYYDDAPFGSVLGDPLTGSMIYDVSVLDAVPGWQEEDAGTAVDPSASAQERADLERAQRIKEGARRRDEAHRQSRRTTSKTTSPTTAPRTASRTATRTASRTTVPRSVPGPGPLPGQVQVPPQAVPVQVPPQIPPQAYAPPAQGAYGAGQPYPGDGPWSPGPWAAGPAQGGYAQGGYAQPPQVPGLSVPLPYRGPGGGPGSNDLEQVLSQVSRQVQLVSKDAQSLGWEGIKPYLSWIVLLLIILGFSVFA